MTDIHCHAIPMVDDGSPSMEASLAILRHEIENGVDAVICTPHHRIIDKYVKSAEEIKARFQELKDAAQAAQLPIRLYLGQEIYYNTNEDIFGMLKNGELLTMNGGNRILLEFLPIVPPSNLHDLVFNCIVKGYEPIIAHAERYRWMTYELIEEMKQEGALIQLNASSVIGKAGLKRRFFTSKLIKNGLVDFIAGDAHSFRPCFMAEALKKTKRPDLFEYDLP